MTNNEAEETKAENANTHNNNNINHGSSSATPEPPPQFYQEDELTLEVPIGIVPDEIVTCLTSNFKRKAVVLALNHKYAGETIELPIDLKDWEGTNLRLAKLLTDKKSD
jgi:hypothetical protein